MMRSHLWGNRERPFREDSDFLYRGGNVVGRNLRGLFLDISIENTLFAYNAS